MAWDKDKIRHFIGLCLAFPGFCLLYGLLAISLDRKKFSISHKVNGVEVVMVDNHTFVKISLILGIAMLGFGVLLGRRKFDIRNVWWVILAAGIAGVLAD